VVWEPSVRNAAELLRIVPALIKDLHERPVGDRPA
jgi:hypothetical protein